MVPKLNTVAAVMAELDMSHREPPHSSAVQQQRLGSLTGRTRLGEDEYGLLVSFTLSPWVCDTCVLPDTWSTAVILLWSKELNRHSQPTRESNKISYWCSRQNLVSRDTSPSNDAIATG